MKRLKRLFICGALCAAVLTSSYAFPAFAAENKHYYFNDFTNDTSDKYVKKLEDGEWVRSGEDAMEVFRSNPINSGKLYMGLDANWETLSGDVQSICLIPVNGNWITLFGGYGGAVKYVGEDSTDWQPWEGSYDAPLNTWIHFDLLIDLDTGNIDFYHDGEKWGSQVLSAKAMGFVKNGIKGFQFRSGTAPGCRTWYIDNLLLTDIDDYIRPTLNVNKNDSYIDINFNAPLSNEDKAAITTSYVKIAENGGSGKLNTDSVTKLSATSYRIKYSGTLDNTKEYYVEFPNTVTGLFNQKLSDNRVYFSGSGSSVISAITLIDAKGNEEGILSPNDEIAQIKFELNSGIAKSDLDNITLAVDGETVETERELNGNIYTMRFDDIIGAGKECVLNIPSSVSEVDNSTRKFTTGAGKFEMRSLKFEKNDGTEAAAISEADSLNAEIINTNNSEKNIYVLFCAYDSAGKMTDFKLTKADLTRKRTEAKIDNLSAGGANKIKGFIIEETQSNESYIRNPLVAAVELKAE